jgi:hypothetical protein
MNTATLLCRLIEQRIGRRGVLDLDFVALQIGDYRLRCGAGREYAQWRYD